MKTDSDVSVECSKKVARIGHFDVCLAQLQSQRRSNKSITAMSLSMSTENTRGYIHTILNFEVRQISVEKIKLGWDGGGGNSLTSRQNVSG